jgi:cleavage and polyadenylation specificity factor subunit 2
MVHFVDLEGLNDGRALKNILPHVNPRRLVSLRGSIGAQSTNKWT